MHILIAPDKFKGTLTAMDVCKAIENGILEANPSATCVLHPLADGGDGSIDILKSCLDIKEIKVNTFDPLGKGIQASYFVSKDTAFIELASASGYALLSPEERNPLYTSTFGTGILFRDALQKGYKKIYVFLGGSATNDAAIGIAAACGYRFLDKIGQELKPIGENLIKIISIDNSKLIPQLENVEIDVLCDVSNPLYGLNGAAYVYGPQKGATPAMVVALDNGLKNFAKVVNSNFNIDLQTIIGGGAAGGCAAGMVGLFNARLQKGTDTIFALTDFENEVKSADVIITGEGRLDQQTLQGKVIHGVSLLAKKHKKPLFVIVGQNTLTKQESTSLHANGIYSIMEAAGGDTKPAFANAKEYLKEIAKRTIEINPVLISTNI